MHQRAVAVVAVGRCAGVEAVAEAPSALIEIDIMLGELVLLLFLAEPNDHEPHVLSVV